MGTAGWAAGADREGALSSVYGSLSILVLVLIVCFFLVGI